MMGDNIMEAIEIMPERKREKTEKILKSTKQERGQ